MVAAPVRPAHAASTSSASTTLRIPILIYHTVRPARPTDTASQQQYNVPPDVFESELKYLQDHSFTVISMDQFLDDLKSGTTSPVEKPVVLTFDDGTRSQYEYAFPLLQQYHDTATFYVYTNPLDMHNENFVSWDELREMADAGMTIGSHTVTHPYLNRLTPEELHHELFDSKAALEAGLGMPVRHFATPFGALSPAIESVARDAGYETVRGTYWGAHHAPESTTHLTGFFAPHDLSAFAEIVEKAP
jgi:peptidoglycan/xylan/chitin deacetylase (PgdA/CDA1 family)